MVRHTLRLCSFWRPKPWRLTATQSSGSSRITIWPNLLWDTSCERERNTWELNGYQISSHAHWHGRKRFVSGSRRGRRSFCLRDSSPLHPGCRNNWMKMETWAMLMPKRNTRSCLALLKVKRLGASLALRWENDMVWTARRWKMLLGNGNIGGPKTTSKVQYQLQIMTSVTKQVFC